MEDAGNGRQQVDAALGRPADRQRVVTDCGREPQRGIVLVEIATLQDENGDTVIGDGGGLGGEDAQVVFGQPATLRQAPAGDAQIAREHRPNQGRIRARAGMDPLDAHSPAERAA